LAIVLDTTALPAADRVASFRSAFGDVTVPSDVRLEDPDRFNARLDWWQFGRVGLLRADLTTGSKIVRTVRQAHRQLTSAVLISTQEQGDAFVAQHGGSELLQTGLACTDLTAPYEFVCPRGARGLALQIPTEDLALPMSLILRAQKRLATSTMSGLVRWHITEVARQADTLSADPGAAGLGTASVELVRALLVSAAADRSAPDVLAETLLTRIRVYVRQHLTEPDLRAERIAAAHHISERYLYSLCSNAGFSLAHWIMSLRLSHACQELVSPRHLSRSIAVIAHRSGFADASHFSRRFREEFGMTPTEWRRAATTSGDEE
jgi:AraC-like DNA-binding protein